MKIFSNLKRIAIAISLALIPFISTAYDFMVDGLCYNKNADGSSVTVTGQNSSSPSYTKLSGEITIPPTVTYDNTTYSVTEIGMWTFYGCVDITNINISNSVVSIGNYAFQNCSGLKIVSFGNSINAIGGSAFSDCGCLTSIAIPNSVVSIGNYAFSGCSGLKNVTLGNSITSIGSGAFAGCNELTEVIWNIRECNDFTDYNSVPFYNLLGIESFSFGNEVQNIPAYLCHGLSNLMTVTIPNSVSTIGIHAFENCKKLKTLTIGNAVTSIGDGAFSGCSGLTSVSIPKSVNSIGSGAFASCSGLIKVNWNATNCNDFTNFNSAPFYNLLGIKKICFGNEVNKIPTLLCYGLSNLTSVTIPSSVTSIGNSAFRGCSGLTSVTIPGSVTSIGSSAFSGCCGLTSVTIPNSVTSIGSNTFRECTGMTSIEIPNSVSSIGYGAFYGCMGLKSVVNLALEPQNISSFPSYDVFLNLNIAACKLYVWHESLDAYKAADVWKDFDIQDLGGIEDVVADEATKDVEGYYDLKGVRLEEPTRGQVNIVRYKDGTAKKIVIEK